MAAVLLTSASFIHLGSAFAETTAAKAAEPSKPNFLVITWEDVSPRFGCYGDKLASTPTVDRLAAEGIRFDQAYSVSGVCAPSRSAIISARWPVSLGSQHMRSEVKLPPDFRCFPSYLRDAGYYCINPGKLDYNFTAPEGTWDAIGPKAHWRNRKEGQPFLAVYNLVQTHQGPSQRQSTADRQREKLPKDVVVTPDQVTVPGYFPDTPGVRQQIANVYNNIAYTDRLTNGLLRQLSDAGVADDTIVILYGDHGDGIPRVKCHLYHESLRVPLIVKIPPKFRNATTPAPGSSVQELVSLMDLGPTMLSLAGLKPPAGWDGRAVLGEYQQAAPLYLFGHRDRIDFVWNFQRTMFDQRWHYIRDFRPDLMPRGPSHSFEPSAILQDSQRLHREGKFTGPNATWLEKSGIPEELYDTQTDPLCLHNLAADPAQSERLATMRRELRDWQVRVRDLSFLPESIQAEIANKYGSPAAIPASEMATLPDLAIAWQRGEEAKPDLQAALQSTHAAERYWAALGLGQLGDATAGDALRRLLEDKTPAVALAAAWSLHRLGQTDAASLETLRRLLRSKRPIPLMETLQIVHHIGPAAAPLKPELQRLTQAKTPPLYARQIRYAAEFALKATQQK